MTRMLVHVYLGAALTWSLLVAFSLIALPAGVTAAVTAIVGAPSIAVLVNAVFVVRREITSTRRSNGGES